MLALQCQTNNVAEYAGLIIGLEASSIFRAFKTSALHTLLSFCAGVIYVNSCEATRVSLQAASQIGIDRITVIGDSQLVIRQVLMLETSARVQPDPCTISNGLVS